MLQGSTLGPLLFLCTPLSELIPCLTCLNTFYMLNTIKCFSPARPLPEPQTWISTCHLALFSEMFNRLIMSRAKLPIYPSPKAARSLVFPVSVNDNSIIPDAQSGDAQSGVSGQGLHFLSYSTISNSPANPAGSSSKLYLGYNHLQRPLQLPSLTWITAISF